jgi:hypothetical protein
MPRGGGWVQLRATSVPRIEARMADPLGGPAWAIRVFLAQRLAPGVRRARACA